MGFMKTEKTAGSKGDTLWGNMIGTDHSGTLDRGNTQRGIRVNSPVSNLWIGGREAGQGNVISGNNIYGIYIQTGADDSLYIMGNKIGTDITGTASIPNGLDAIVFWSNSDRRAWIGGYETNARNVISGNGRYGMWLKDGRGYMIRNNEIGTNASNRNNFGIVAERGEANILFNTLSFNNGNAIEVQENFNLQSISFNTIDNNNGHAIYLNAVTDPTENQDRNVVALNDVHDNAQAGIYFFVNTTIIESGEKNVIYRNQVYDNTQNGILLNNRGTESFRKFWITHNHVHDNGVEGIYLSNNVDSCYLYHDTIYNHPRNGVFMDVTTSIHNLVSRNIIYENGDPLAFEPINLNTFANSDHPAPILLTASATMANGTASPGDTIEVFSSNGTDPNCKNLHNYLGSVVADGGGSWSITFGGLSTGDEVKATARDLSNNNTSEVSECIVILPVTLTEFTAEVVNNSMVRTDWTTVSEKNTDYFTVEKSNDQSLWREIGDLPASGNSTWEIPYTMDDPNPFMGVSWYRLRITDTDGSQTYSRPVMAVITPGGGVAIFPNPLERGSRLTVAYPTMEPRPLVINITDMLGHVVSKIQNNTPESTPETVIETAEFPAGMYLIQVTQGNKEIFRWRQTIID